MNDMPETSEEDARSEAVMALAQDVRPLDETGESPGEHLASKDALAKSTDHPALTADQSDAVLSLAQDIRPLEDPPAKA